MCWKKISEIKKDSTHSGYVHVTGYIKIMSEELKNVWIHTRGSFGKLNENCMILDDTGCMKINIWERCLKGIISGNAYRLSFLNHRNNPIESLSTFLNVEA